MNQKDKKEKEKVPTPTYSEGSCCSFSNTLKFLQEQLGESLEPSNPPEVIDSCDCGCEKHISSQPEVNRNSQDIKAYVKKRYASLVNKSTSCCGPDVSFSSTFHIDTDDKQNYVKQLGYTEVELKELPPEVMEMSFGCGNPTAIAELQPGEVVLDLGSGGGIDVFLAAKKVGPSGRAIGLDMTPIMIERARANAELLGLKNVEFKLGEMEAIPLVDESVDVVISNCVINLSPDKGKVFRQIFRVLKSGGRLAVSDIVLNGELPEFIRKDFEAWVGCIAGALQEEDYVRKIKSAGFVNVTIESKKSVRDLAYTISDPQTLKSLENMGINPENLLNRIVSIKIKANKPVNLENSK
ncbi:MAG: arsenite methyltransferase [Deltaproteobacteria bacterium]|nr:arsenite methyltransferase [Deltaproteobacteria bacterium]